MNENLAQQHPLQSQISVFEMIFFHPDSRSIVMTVMYAWLSVCVRDRQRESTVDRVCKRVKCDSGPSSCMILNKTSDTEYTVSHKRRVMQRKS